MESHCASVLKVSGMSLEPILPGVELFDEVVHCSEDHDDGHDETVQTNSLGENENKDHSYEDIISLGIGSYTGVASNTNGETSSK